MRLSNRLPLGRLVQKQCGMYRREIFIALFVLVKHKVSALRANSIKIKKIQYQSKDHTFCMFKKYKFLTDRQNTPKE